ncbi:MAG: carbohydrate kinase family protein [Chloroflexaceae bacterium]|jgi:sugar/nucleoside kinase (ribokinase family)|nr:carbohydrate kinase family protein [Chloroflexaceae bacterium]
MYDVLCYGAICADHRIWLPHHPRPGEGLRVQREDYVPGGNAFLEARSLADWNHHVVLMGDHLGDDDGGRMLQRAIGQTKIDGRYLVRNADARTPVCRILLTPDAERTILAFRDSATPATLPPADLLARCRIVSVTRYGPRTAEVASLARQANRLTVVGDATRPDDPWAAHADVIVTSASLLDNHQPGVERAAQLLALHQRRGATVLVTDGPRAIRALWQEAGERQSLSITPPAITAHNPIGAGDVFRAGVVHGLLAGWFWPQIVEHACTVATAHVGAPV